MQIVKPSFTIESEVDGIRILKEIERYARNCYKSEGRITEDSCYRLIRTLIQERRPQHLGILEHHVVTVRFICDRGVSHELVRHRIAAYLQESTRYCDYAKAGEIQVIQPPGLDDARKLLYWINAMKQAELSYRLMRECGVSPQIARSVLPNSLKTEIIATLDLNSWRNFFIKRTDKAAHPQMRELAVPLLAKFKELIPVVFDDIVCEPYIICEAA